VFRNLHLRHILFAFSVVRSVKKGDRSVRDLKITLIGICLPLMASPLLSQAQSAQPAAAPVAGVADTTGGVTTQSDDQLSEIVVTGLRASLEKSLDLKRNASVVIDSINQEELGRFPDADVADSLEHLPGITLDRTTGGEGEKVSVRGFGPQYNITTLNNRILATDDDSRDIAFDVLPSEVISGADVLKTSEASALEGSIGGTVNLRTASPFDNPGFHAGTHAEGNYNEMSDLKGQKYSAFVSDTNDDRTLGFLLGGVYSDNHTRTDSLNAYNQNIYGPTTYPFDGTGNTVPVSVSGCCITFGSIFDDKKREAASAKLEWRPNDALTVVADGLWTHLQDPQVGYNQSYYFQYSTDQFGNPTWFNPTIKNGLITAVTSNNFTPEIVNNTVDRNVVTTMYGLNVAWQPTDRLKFTGDAYRSAAARPEGGEDSFVTAGLVSQTPYSPDIITVTDLPHSLPSLNVYIPPSQLGLTTCPKGSASTTQVGYCSYTALMNSGFLDNNNYWSTHYDGLNGYSVHDQVTGFTLDGAFDAKAGFLDKILFGAGLTHRDKSRTDISNDWTNGSGQYGSLYQTAGCPVQCTPYTFGSQGFDVISFTSPPNFMQGAGGSYPYVLPQLNVANLISFMKSLNGKPNPFYCSSLPCSTPFDFASTLPVANPFNSYDVQERTYSFYVEGTFGGTDWFGKDWSGNLGVRVVRTVTIADTAQNVPVSLWTPSVANATQTFNVQYSAATAFAERDQYTEALPSLNLSYWLVPKTLQLRGALSEDISRPELDQLAPNATNNAINGQPQITYTGTAGLKPIKAYAADFTAEWYYHPHAALTGAFFFKHITDDIYNGTQTSVNLGTTEYVGGPPGTVPGTPFLWTVQAPANGASEVYKGVELAWQHFLEMGLGTHIQLTHTWSPGDAVNAAPPTTFSASLIYDKGPFNADVNWDWTARYNYACPQCTEVPGWPAVADPFSWVTASAHYRIGRGFEVYVEGKNLTNAIARTYLDGNPLLPWAPGQSIGQSSSGVGVGYSAYGRSYIFGASYRY
jgi:TonB-dependent receptor